MQRIACKPGHYKIPECCGFCLPSALVHFMLQALPREYNMSLIGPGIGRQHSVLGTALVLDQVHAEIIPQAVEVDQSRDAARMRHRGLTLRRCCCGNAAGQGLNTALEDGAVLGWWVQEHGLNAEALRSFEKERIPRISKIAEQEQVRVLACRALAWSCLPARACKQSLRLWSSDICMPLCCYHSKPWAGAKCPSRP